MAKRVKIGLLLLFIVLLGGGLYLYLNPKKALHIIIPDVSDIERVHIKFAGDTAYVSLLLHAANKSLFKLDIDTLQYHIQLDTSTMLSKSQPLHWQLKRRQKDTLRLPLALPFKRLMHKIKSLQSQDSVDIPVTVRIVYSTVFGKAVLPYSKNLRIEVPRPPKFRVERTEYVHYHKKELLMNAYLAIENPGKLNLNVSDVTYTLSVKNLLTATGSEPKEIKLKPGTTLSVVLPIKVEFKHLLKTLMLILKNKDKVNYHLTIHGFIQNDQLGEEKTPVVVEKDGKMELKK